jgi:hypothetical protein
MHEVSDRTMVDTLEVIAARLQSSQRGSMENNDDEFQANDCSALP